LRPFPMVTFKKSTSFFFSSGIEARNVELAKKLMKKVQIDATGKELSREFYYPSRNQIPYFLKGKEILDGFDDSLEFYYDLPTKEA
ncbi:MAG: hypothetical protein AAGJ18_05390, partial [Bacteroidota bacterium]